MRHLQQQVNDQIKSTDKRKDLVKKLQEMEDRGELKVARERQALTDSITNTTQRVGREIVVLLRSGKRKRKGKDDWEKD